MMHKKTNNYKKELEQLYTKEDNSTCFDCEKTPAHWASVNNGIYLCLDCSGEHRGYGVNVSYIKSVTLDQWNENQMNLLRVGGNYRLKNFLETYDMPFDKDKKDIYSSKIMSHYRRMLKAEGNGEIFVEPLPLQDEFWENASSGDTYYGSNNNNSFQNQLFSKGNSNAGDYQAPMTISDNQYMSQVNNPYPSFNNNTGTSSSSNMQFPKNEIIINDNHYQEANRYSDLASTFSNKIPTEPKFARIDPKYKNDPRYGSVGSEPYDPYASSSSSSGGGVSSYWPGVSSLLGSVWGTSVNVASAIKDKMSEIEMGSKLLYAGGKTLEVIAYTGGKVYEKGSEIITSDTVRNIASTAGNGIVYLKDKIVNGTSSQGGSNSRSYKDDRYNSRGSDDYRDYNDSSLIDKGY